MNQEERENEKGIDWCIVDSGHILSPLSFLFPVHTLHKRRTARETNTQEANLTHTLSPEVSLYLFDLFPPPHTLKRERTATERGDTVREDGGKRWRESDVG